MKNGLKTILFLILMVVFLLGITGCSGENPPKRLWLKTDTWSRALYLGETGGLSSPPLALDDQGQIFSLLFKPTVGRSGIYNPQLVKMDQTGRISGRFDLPHMISNPKESRLIIQGETIKVFFISRRSLFMGEVSTEGKLVGRFEVISGEAEVGSYDVVTKSSGEMILWYTGTRRNPGLYSLTFHGDQRDEDLIDNDGVRVNLVLDQNEILHASWAHYPLGYGEIDWIYGYYPEEKFQSGRETFIFTRGISSALQIEGPCMGLDDQHVYILWSEKIVTGLDAGSGTSYLQSFPVGAVEKITEPRKMLAPRSSGLQKDYLEPGGFKTGERISLQEENFFPANGLFDLDTNQDQYFETALAFQSTMEYSWRQTKNQINIIYLSEGEITSFQPLSFSSTPSKEPRVSNDQIGNLYLVWLEDRGNMNDVYFATTNPEYMKFLNKITGEDVLILAGEMAFGLLAGIILSPFAAAVWGGLSMIALLINKFFIRFQKQAIQNLGQILSLAGALFIYWWLKFATLPGIDGDYVPFSAWIPRIPEGLEGPLKIGVPVVIGLVALFLAWNFTYRKKNTSPMYFLMIYAGVDALFSTAVYGVLIYGTF